MSPIMKRIGVKDAIAQHTNSILGTSRHKNKNKNIQPNIISGISDMISFTNFNFASVDSIDDTLN